MTTDAPVSVHREIVRPEWIDYNGHLNMAYYVLVFDHATDAFLNSLGVDSDYRARTHSTTYTLETHVTYERELKLGDPIEIKTQLLDYDSKRLHYFHTMYHAEQGFLAATTELILMLIDTRTVRSTTMEPEVLKRVEQMLEMHRRLPRPPQVGRIIGIRSKKG